VIEPDEEDRRMWPQMDYYFSSPQLSDYLIKKIKCCGIVMGKFEQGPGAIYQQLDGPDRCLHAD
jgi:hypothetical protein